MAAVPEQMAGQVNQNDLDPIETKEWLEALDGVIAHEGTDRAAFLIDQQIAHARVNGVDQPFHAETPYINTIPVEIQARIPGDQNIEHRIRSYTRWNAMAMVLRANKDTNVGGHISSFQSAATLYDVGYNHFWHAPSEQHGGDLIFVQGHSAPGVYARAYMLGRLSDEQLNNFRQEVNGKGISSYPHPWLMPDFWQFPTVSMGLGPIMAIYQARFMHYLQDRGLATTAGRKVWAFLGDGETDEPESLGAIGMAGREKLDNLIFVVNCNLQRLDGPVRGNGKIIQELESEFRGSGWNVIKVVWGGHWDALFARDKKGILMQRLAEIVDGQYQTMKAKNGAYVRETVFNTPELKALVADWSDEDIWNLNRGGHDPHKVYAAFHSAANHKGQPTVILAKTIKGYGMGGSGEGMNIAHQAKKMSHDDVVRFRDRFEIPVSDDQLEEMPLVKFPEGSPELEYMRTRRMELGGYLPQRRTKAESLPVPINEAGGMCDWIAAATSYSTHGVPMLPFYIFYSMFGFQRIGDLAWAAGDMRSRGFLLGGTAGRTTLNGEGLQHEDGHSQIWASAVPNCISYDPTFAFELAVVIQDGMRRMLTEQEDVYYYVTLMNENYSHPAMPKGAEQDIIKGMYRLQSVGEANNPLRVQLLGSGTIFREVMAAAEMLHAEWGIASDLWGCPSMNELGRDWNETNRSNLLNPGNTPKLSHVERLLKDTKGPVIAATDYMR
ncbi:MAG: pyruvate dehydrogenase E1 component, partial [Burkholderiaceae bacterium]|nr:pyruvate dehydrogenase E1 component [Burkholderiaceae bacterium]